MTNNDSFLPLPPQQLWAHWTEPAYNRWAFRHIDQFLACDRIASSRQPRFLEADQRPLQELCFHAPDDTLISVAEALEFLYADALVVLKGERILYEAYFNAMQASTPHILFSATKPFASVLVSALVGQAYLHGEDDLLLPYLPDLSQDVFGDVRLRHLLDMQSGIDQNDLSDRDQLERACGFAPPKPGEHIQALIQRLQHKKFPAGEQVDYNSINTDVISLLSSELTGQPVYRLVERHIYQIIGAEFEGLLLKDSQGINELGGGMAICARDLARFGLALLEGETIEPVCGFSQLIDSAEPDKWQRGWLAQLTPQAKAYRAALYVSADDYLPGALFATGNHGQALLIDPRSNIVIALLASAPSALDLERFQLQMGMLRSIVEGLS